MADFSKAPESKNFVDKTGATPYNDVRKFLAALSFALGIEEKMQTPAEKRAADEKFNREQEEYAKKWRESVGKSGPAEVPIFPELDKLWRETHKR